MRRPGARADACAASDCDWLLPMAQVHTMLAWAAPLGLTLSMSYVQLYMELVQPKVVIVLIVI